MSRDSGQAGGQQQPPHGITLIMVMLQEQPAPGSQGLPGASGNGPDGQQTIRAAIKGGPGLMILHTRL